MFTICTWIYHFLADFLVGYFEGAKWFFSIIKAIYIDNPIYLWERHIPLFFLYLLFIRYYTMRTYESTMELNHSFHHDFGGPKYLHVVLELLIVIGIFAAFYNLTFQPHHAVWMQVKSLITLIYVENLQEIYAYHKVLGVIYFCVVDYYFGLMMIIGFTSFFHGDNPLEGATFGFSSPEFRHNLMEHNKFMQLVNIEKAINKIGRK